MLKRTITSLLHVCCFCFAMSSCISVKEVSFKNYVDTISKPIKLQTKKRFSVPELNIFASNTFDGARLNDLTKLNDSTVIAFIEPENTPINNSAYYAFDIWSKTYREIYIQFKYPETFSHRYHPKIKKDQRWTLLDSNSISSPKKKYTIKLNISPKKTRIAAQEVHSSRKVKSWYTQLSATNKPLIKLTKIGVSKLGRELVVLDIHKGTKKNKPIIILLTRQHPPEVTGYFAFQEFVQTITTDELSDEFLTNYRVLAFPLLNPDGVDLGHWRHNAGGIDLNRDWSKYNQPEIKHVVRYITKELRKSNTKIVLGLDFHSTWYDIFYTNEKRKETALPNFISDWFHRLEKHIPKYKVNEAASNSTKPVSKGWFLYGFGATGITYEIGDETSRAQIALLGQSSAKLMMQILLEENQERKAIQH